jgi:hypothetical protein
LTGKVNEGEPAARATGSVKGILRVIRDGCKPAACTTGAWMLGIWAWVRGRWDGR